MRWPYQQAEEASSGGSGGGTAVVDAPAGETLLGGGPMTTSPPAGQEPAAGSGEPAPRETPPRQEAPPRQQQRQASPATTGADEGNLLDWRSLAPEDVRSDKVLQKYQSMGDALKALVHAERELGGRVKLPGPEAPQQEWEQFYARLGRPEKPGDYQLTEPDMPEGLSIDDEFRTRLLEEGHALGMTPKQMQGLLEFTARTITDAHSREQGMAALQRAEGERTLAQAFGASAPRILAQANMVFDMLAQGRFGGEYGVKAREEWLQSDLANSPNMVAMLASIWEQLGESRFVDDHAGGPLTSQETLEARRAELMTKVMNERTPWAERETAQRELQGVYQQLARMRDAEERRANRTVYQNSR